MEDTRIGCTGCMKLVILLAAFIWAVKFLLPILGAGAAGGGLLAVLLVQKYGALWLPLAVLLGWFLLARYFDRRQRPPGPPDPS